MIDVMYIPHCCCCCDIIGQNLQLSDMQPTAICTNLLESLNIPDWHNCSGCSSQSAYLWSFIKWWFRLLYPGHGGDIRESDNWSNGFWPSGKLANIIFLCIWILDGFIIGYDMLDYLPYIVIVINRSSRCPIENEDDLSPRQSSSVTEVPPTSII